MTELCFNSMNRSAYLLGEEDPDLPGQIAAAGAAGFTCFGPDAYSIARYCDEGNRVEALADQIAAAGMRTFELPTLMIDADSSTNVRETERLAGYAEVLRPEFVQLNIGSAVTEGVIEDLRRAGAIFAEIDCRLAIEYLPWLPAVRDLSSTLALLSRAKLEGAGVLVDTWHFTHSGDTWGELESLPLEAIAYLQFDDHPPLASDDLVHETVHRRVMPGEGEFELDRFVAALKEKGYAGVVSCEVLSQSTRELPHEEFAARLFATSRRFWSA